jgi:hypothetical protein
MTTSTGQSNTTQQLDLAEHVQVSLKEDFNEYDSDGKVRVQFLRVEVKNVDPAIESIIKEIAETSWIDSLADEVLRDGFRACAKPTIEKLSTNLKQAIEHQATETIGEYIVSMVARYIIEAEYGYRALPLAEILKEQKSGNPGFDFHHEKDSLILIFGEAKYKSGTNAYGSAFTQITKHIAAGKDLKEIPVIRDFVSDNAKINLHNGKKGYSAAFSTQGKAFDSRSMISSIKRNTHFEQLVSHEALLVIAVDING